MGDGTALWMVEFKRGPHRLSEALSAVGQGAIGKSRHCRPLEETDSVHATVDTDDLDDVSLWRDGGVQRTVVHFLPCHLDAASVVQSSTEAHGGGTNPRRVARD